MIRRAPCFGFWIGDSGCKSGTSSNGRKGALLLALLLAPLGLLGQPTVLHQQTDRQPVADGVELIRIRQFDTEGWLNIFALEIDHTRSHLSLDALLGKNQLTGAQPLSQTVRERGAIGAINGDFFHIQTTGAPIAGHIQSGELFKSPPAGERALSAGIDGRSLPFIGPVLFDGRIANSAGASRRLDGWNSPVVPANGIIHYNRRWGVAAPGPESPDMPNWPGLVHVVLNDNQEVVRLLKGQPGPKVPEGGAVLAGRGEGASWLLRHASAGEILEIDHGFSPETLTAAIGGFPVLVENGAVVVPPNPRDVHPRSAFAYNEDKTRSWFVVVDGRSPLSRGVDLNELAIILKNFGAYHALNLDGGGTTTLIARTPGGEAPSVQNVPSDGRERAMPNGLGIFNSAPVGSISNLFIQPPPPPDNYTIEGEEFRLAPGTNFQPKVFATDQNINRITLPAPVHWDVTPAELGSFSADGLFLAKAPGRGKITASVSVGGRHFETSLPVRVIGRPVLLQADPPEIVLSPHQGTGLALHAVDARGYVAPLAGETVEWTVKGGIGEVRNGRFIAGEATGSGALEAKFGDLRKMVPVGIGDRPVLVASFDDDEAWWTHSVPEEVKTNLSLADHLPFIRERLRATKLEYDFTGTTRTRAAYVRPRGDQVELPGRPLRLGLWVFGDGQKAWLRGHLVDGSGTVHTMDFSRNIDWTGWRYIQAEIPPGLDYPLSLRSIYVVETRPDVQYSGAIYFDEVLAVNAPHIDPVFLAEEVEPRDPANRPEQPAVKDEENFRFIVFGDSKLMSATPQSPEGRVLAGLIEQINREEIEFVLFTGDLLEHETGKHLRLRKDFLDRLQAPHYLPNTTHYSFVRGDSKFVVLNTADRGLRASEAKQWLWLQELLARTEAENFFILTHTPVIDPMPGGNRGWSDNSEVSLFQRLLAREANKRRNVYVFHGYAHGFHRRAFDGVQYLTTAGAGSPLLLPADKGGFHHYLIVTVKGAEVTYQVVPLLEKIELAEKLEAKPGEMIELTADGVALGEQVRFPLCYPAAVEWTVEDPGIARIDPATGALRALQPGETEVTVRSGGVTASTRLSVTP